VLLDGQSAVTGLDVRAHRPLHRPHIRARVTAQVMTPLAQELLMVALTADVRVGTGSTGQGLKARLQKIQRTGPMLLLVAVVL
jgi:hypothetical protein